MMNFVMKNSASYRTGFGEDKTPCYWCLYDMAGHATVLFFCANKFSSNTFSKRSSRAARPHVTGFFCCVRVTCMLRERLS